MYMYSCPRCDWYKCRLVDKSLMFVTVGDDPTRLGSKSVMVAFSLPNYRPLELWIIFRMGLLGKFWVDDDDENSTAVSDLKSSLRSYQPMWPSPSYLDINRLARQNRSRSVQPHQYLWIYRPPYQFGPADNTATFGRRNATGPESP